jgi:leader peptidase (prepilin peptidase) / N-methyltransferase
METALALVALAPGLAIGSFLNVVAARVPRHLSIVSPGSSCPQCSSPIAWYDNVPLVSYLVLRGRCRSCGWAIPWKYPAVEVGTAILVSASLARFGLTAHGLVAVLLCCALVAVTVTDLERRVIPNRIVLPAAVVAVTVQTAADRSPEWAIAAFAAALFLLVAALAYPGGMGMGDVKLALLLGAALGRTVAVGLMIGFVAALVPAVVLLVKHGSAARKMALPFGPFLALGGLAALFLGNPILRVYLHGG